MRLYLPAILIALSCVGCDQTNTKPSMQSGTNTTQSGTNTTKRDTSATTSRDNSAVNDRDRDSATKTPLDQNENTKDIGITADIRKLVVDTEMSVNARNVKIITQDGKVTLRGPVKTDDEKKRIEEFARSVAGDNNVDSQLEVQ